MNDDFLYYRCVMVCDVTYLSTRNNEMEKISNLSASERFRMQYENQEIPHSIRFKPADSFKNRAADILAIPADTGGLAWFFLESREKMVSRTAVKDGIPQPGVREYRPKRTKIKFELIEDPSAEDKARAIPLKLRDFDTAAGLEKLEKLEKQRKAAEKAETAAAGKA